MNNILNELIAQTKSSKKKTDKQQKIAEAAIRLFAEKGYANTSTSEIAKAAGVAEGTIFRHYKTKDNLLLSLILPFLKEALPAMAEDVLQDVMSKETGSFESFLRALIKNRIQFIKENREIFQVFVKELIYNDELKKELLPLFTENIVKRIGVVVDLYKERGELIDLPPGEIEKVLFTFFGGYFLSRFIIIAIEPEDEELEIENLIRFAMEGIKKRND